MAPPPSLPVSPTEYPAVYPAVIVPVVASAASAPSTVRRVVLPLTTVTTNSAITLRRAETSRRCIGVCPRSAIFAGNDSAPSRRYVSHASYNVNPTYTLLHDTANSQRFRSYLCDGKETTDFLVDYFIPHIEDMRGRAVITGFDRDAARVFRNVNAGGNSIVSEALTADIFTRVHRGRGVRTEMEIQYIWSNWKICDMTIKLPTSGDLNRHAFMLPSVDPRGRIEKSKYVNVGVSVTRAMMYPSPDDFTLEDANTLLNKKLNGLISARGGVCDCDAFYKSILHIWCQTERIAELLHEAYRGLDAATRDNVLIMCTVAPTAPYVFFNYYDDKPPPVRARSVRDMP